MDLLIDRNSIITTHKGFRGHYLIVTSRDNLHRRGLFLGFLFNIKSYPFDAAYLTEVTTPEQYLSVVQNMKNKLSEIDDTINRLKADNGTSRTYIEEIRKLKLNYTDRQYAKFEALVKIALDRDKLKYRYVSDASNLVTVGNTIAIPRRVEPFFYNTEDDLLSFDTKDIVEVTFQDKLKVQKDLRGKTLKYVVNNGHKYAFINKTKRLALTPVTEGWKTKDAIIIDDADRFECLMGDLFPVNRRPFYGWRNKEVTIKKVGTVDTLPKYKEYDAIKSFLKMQSPPFYVFYDGIGKNVVNVTKKSDFFCKSLVTTTAAKKAIAFLEERIDKKDKEIESHIQSKKDLEDLIKIHEEFDYTTYFKERYTPDGMSSQRMCQA